MTGDARAASVIFTIAAVTVGLRVLPFVALDMLTSSRYLRYLGVRMPTGVMIILVAYTLKDLDVTAYPYGLPELISLFTASVLYWIKNNALLAIAAGLAVFMLAVNVVV